MDEHGSFWSSVPGVVTAAAGILTAIVGLLTVSVQAGWIGGGSSGDGGSGTSSSGVPSSSVVPGSGAPGSTVKGGSPASTSSGGSAPSAAAFSVDPTSVEFPSIGTRQASVTVRNTGDVALTVKTPTVTGPGAVNFTAADVDCTRDKLAAGRSCSVQVAFAPKGAGQFSAVLVVAANEASKQQEVDLTGSALVG